MKTLKPSIRLLLTVVTFVALALPAVGEEIVVQNDSVTELGQAVIVGDFVAGERAGARLTSPCDGTIVGVQILWLQGTPGHGESLEDSITIAAGSTFPTPGATLAFLEGPVMTPGYWNEFRYLDEAQTMPINVPVTEGQQFYVYLQFYNPTDVGNGGPSVVRDVSGCQAGKNVLYAIPGGWLNFCLLLGGDLAIRAVIECPDPTGACCDADAICTSDVAEGDCQGPGETWYEGQTCAEVVPCPAPTGACCNGIGGCLAGLTQEFCEQTLGFIYGGNGTTCDVCDLGACCMPDGSCQDVIEIVCSDDGGTFEGAGTTCASTSCPQPTGACCLGTNCVPNQTQANCDSVSGEWQGAFTDCGPPNPCEAPGWCLGDMNCSSGSPEFTDIAYFVAALNGEANWSQYYRDHNGGVDPDCYWLMGDYSDPRDGVDFLDIVPFANSIGQPCVPFTAP